jgi:hypothetical protein
MRLVTLLAACLIASCGKDSGGAAEPRPEPSVDDERAEPELAVTSTGDTGDDPEVDRLRLDTEFHRTRFGPDIRYWVLGVVHNPHAERVTDVRVRVGLLDEAERVVATAEGRLERPLAPGERAAAAVLVPAPVAHEHLSLTATAIVDARGAPEPLPLRLNHDEPRRGEFGGWCVSGRVENTGAAAIEGAKIEIQGLDAGARLLGIDWWTLPTISAGDTVDFEVGDLRYEEVPKRFLVELRRPGG